MARKSVLRNIKDNRMPLLAIAMFSLVFAVKGPGQDSTPDSSGRSEGGDIIIGLYKEGKDSKEYFSGLRAKVEEAASVPGCEFRFVFDYYNSQNKFCKALEDGEIHIGGELKPIQYVRNYEDHGFSAFIGIEYNGEPYYRSVLFAADTETDCDCGIRDKPGVDNVAIIGSILDAADSVGADRGIALRVKQSESTSGYYYPRSYMIDHGLKASGVKELSSEALIYEKALKRPSTNSSAVSRAGDDCHGEGAYVAGFMAEYLYKAYRKDSVRFPDSAYYRPFVIDMSDPIPNGVFAMSGDFAKSDDDRVERLRRFWKTLRPIENSQITGWRSGVERDLELVQAHYRNVTYFDGSAHNYRMYLSMTIAGLMLLVFTVSYRQLRKLG